MMLLGGYVMKIINKEKKLKLESKIKNMMSDFMEETDVIQKVDIEIRL